ncbi:MAG: imidazole glycerol phosphate synthase subunit HisH [Mariprofundaceae bacterium]|nr:imidazole glycerol phosphate synthase subunit HisH [Mariprofundaceae bacterium]
MTIALVNYGMGNIHSVAKALERVGGKVRIATTPDDLKDASRIVLPGVGAFRDCIASLRKNDLDQALLESMRSGTPYLGICLGMQILLDESYEFGEHKGLGVIAGSVKHFPAHLTEDGIKIPHMGWNDVIPATEAHPVLASLRAKQCYYVHSYVCVPKNPQHIQAACSYGNHPFAAAIGKDNILGVQFHPEKSQAAGLAMLEAFTTWNP